MFGLREPVNKPNGEEAWLEVDDEVTPEELARLAAALCGQTYSELDPPPEPAQPAVRMTMPEEIYTAEERRRIAHARHKQRKAQSKSPRTGRTRAAFNVYSIFEKSEMSLALAVKKAINAFSSTSSRINRMVASPNTNCAAPM